MLAVLLAPLFLAGATPDYVVIRHELPVARAPEAVWARIGDYCAIRTWMAVTCDYASGTGAVGTVRRLRDGTIAETMVAQTAHSYTYWQTQGPMAPYAYHGTLAVEPVGARAARLTYTLVYDQAAMPSAAVRASEHARLDTRFATLLGAIRQMAKAR